MSVSVIDGIRTRIIRRFSAPPERLYRAFTDPREAAAWMWGSGAPNPSAEMDVRVGGRYRVGRDAPPDDDSGWPSDRWAFSGVFVELDPPRKLVYTLHWEGPVGYNQTDQEVFDEAVIVTFEPDESGTLLVFEHVGIPDDGISAAEHGKGVAATFDTLAEIVEGWGVIAPAD